MTLRSTVAAMLLTAFASSAFAATFDILGSSQQFVPRAISSDGSTVIGDGLTLPLGTTVWPMSWTRSAGLNYVGTPDLSIKYSIPAAISADAKSFAGYFQDDDGNRTAYRWTQSTGYQTLASGANIISRSESRAISADGSVIVGQASFDFGRRGFRSQRRPGPR